MYDELLSPERAAALLGWSLAHAHETQQRPGRPTGDLEDHFIPELTRLVAVVGAGDDARLCCALRWQWSARPQAAAKRIALTSDWVPATKQFAADATLHVLVCRWKGAMLLPVGWRQIHIT